MKFCYWTNPNPSELSWVEFISKICRHVLGYLVPDVSRKVVASSLRIEMAKRNFFMFLVYFTLESETLTLSPNVSNGITNDENSHPCRTAISSIPLWELKNSHNWFRFGVSFHVPVTFDLILPCSRLVKSVTIKTHVSRLMMFLWEYTILHNMEEILKSLVLDTAIVLFLRASRSCHCLTQHNIVFHCYN